MGHFHHCATCSFPLFICPTDLNPVNQIKLCISSQLTAHFPIKELMRHLIKFFELMPFAFRAQKQLLGNKGADQPTFLDTLRLKTSADRAYIQFF